MAKRKPPDTPRLKPGPPAAPPDQQRLGRTVRMNAARWEKLKAIHARNPQWLEYLLDATPWPPTQAPKP